MAGPMGATGPTFDDDPPLRRREPKLPKEPKLVEVWDEESQRWVVVKVVKKER